MAISAAFSICAGVPPSTAARPAAAMEAALEPRGTAVMIEAEHMCMSMRGVQKAGATTLTTRFTGQFKNNPAEQARFLTMVRHGKG